MANSRLYRIAAAAEQSCVLQAAATALHIACACVRIKRVRVRGVCSKVVRALCTISVVCLRAVTVLDISLLLRTCSDATTEGKMKGCRLWRLAYALSC